MRKIAFFLPLVSLALAACGDSADEPQTQEEIADAASSMTKPKAGQYSSTAQVVAFEAPGLPPAQAEQMKQMFSGLAAQEQSYCLTQEDADKGFEEAVKQMNEPDDGQKCQFDKFSVDGNRLDARMSCESGEAGTSTMNMAGTIDEEQQDLTMEVKQESSQIPGGVINITMRVKSQRTGECEAS
jgi:hypothetical protein